MVPPTRYMRYCRHERPREGLHCGICGSTPGRSLPNQAPLGPHRRTISGISKRFIRAASSARGRIRSGEVRTKLCQTYAGMAAILRLTSARVLRRYHRRRGVWCSGADCFVGSAVSGKPEKASVAFAAAGGLARTAGPDLRRLPGERRVLRGGRNLQRLLDEQGEERGIGDRQ